MIDYDESRFWRSSKEHVSATARAHQIARRLRSALEGSGDDGLRSVSGGDLATLLELRDFSEAKACKSILLADQLSMRNRNCIKNLQSRHLIERVQGSGVRWEVTSEGLDLAKAVEPMMEEVCLYC